MGARDVEDTPGSNPSLFLCEALPYTNVNLVPVSQHPSTLDKMLADAETIVVRKVTRPRTAPLRPSIPSVTGCMQVFVL